MCLCVCAATPFDVVLKVFPFYPRFRAEEFLRLPDLACTRLESMVRRLSLSLVLGREERPRFCCKNVFLSLQDT